MSTTNYTDTFIRVANDCPATVAEVPPVRATPTVATLQYELVSEHPYRYTSDDVLFEVHATRRGVPAQDREAAREALFSTGQPCLRSSPLPQRYGWGVHHDAEGRVALVALGSDRYRELSEDPTVRQLRAMRSRRA